MGRPEDNGADGSTEADTTELRLLEAAVAEARAGGPGIPHDVMRERMLEMIARARRVAAERLAAAGK
jgi:hypothetical protein